MAFTVFEGNAAPCAGTTCTTALPAAPQGTLYYDSSNATLWEYTGTGTTKTVTELATGDGSNDFNVVSGESSVFAEQTGAAPTSLTGTPYSVVYTINGTSGSALWVADSAGYYQFVANLGSDGP
jgi:hypothetical protein